ncbi:hypothetical protein EDEG_03527 [Edhazardia aedis USNM 41457]|uniref:Uncharacterized protein n=1 Tax=Edhazardia aedis (strain USNM 41457) TaxID=1003232 RepID=J9DKV9_EDHAE|nr:hypothetical protein EDEG_03527 [Edhazardia aedis USNM 41457]|eukprot:EJW02017.1 hypothetical protein EDEG_03527 [Edhazardia aedis USNM 41457]
MFKKICGLTICMLAFKKLYDYFLKKLLSDKKYLENIIKVRKESPNEDMIIYTIEQGNKLVTEGDVQKGLHQFIFAYKILKCDWDRLMSAVQSDEIRQVLTMSKSEIDADEENLVHENP